MATINTWQEIDEASNGLVTNLTYVALFLNDQIYNYSLLLYEEMKKTSFYRQKAKKLTNEIKVLSEKYNVYLGGIVRNGGKYSLAVITSSIEEDVQPHIEKYKFAISQILLSNGICGDINRCASISSTINMLSQTSSLTINDFGELVKGRYKVANNPLDYLKLDRIEYLSGQLCNVICGDVNINLNNYPAVMTAFKAMTNSLLRPEVFIKAFNDVEEQRSL